MLLGVGTQNYCLAYQSYPNSDVTAKYYVLALIDEEEEEIYFQVVGQVTPVPGCITIHYMQDARGFCAESKVPYLGLRGTVKLGDIIRFNQFPKPPSNEPSFLWTFRNYKLTP